MFFSIEICAQVDSLVVEQIPIISSKRKKEGIYKTFDKFKRNEPIETDSFRIIHALSGNQNQDYVDKVILSMNGNQMKRTADKFFGYCFNDTCYVSLWRFHAISEFGHLSAIWVQEVRQQISDQESGYGTGLTDTGPTLSDDSSELRKMQVTGWYVLDLSNGKIHELNSEFLMKKLQVSDKELSETFAKQGEKHKPSVMLEFVRKFNQRNPIRF